MIPVNINADLHCHSTASDGTLPPREVVARAAKNGVEMLSLTDHDTTAGLNEAYLGAQEQHIRLIPGIELSVTWQGKLLHIIGLDIDPEHLPLKKGIRMLKEMREERALEMGRRLDKAGYRKAYENARRLAGNGNVTRTHFALHLIEAGLARDFNYVFKIFNNSELIDFSFKMSNVGTLNSSYNGENIIVYGKRNGFGYTISH